MDWGRAQTICQSNEDKACVITKTNIKINVTTSIENRNVGQHLEFFI